MPLILTPLITLPGPGPQKILKRNVFLFTNFLSPSHYPAGPNSSTILECTKTLQLDRPSLPLNYWCPPTWKGLLQYVLPSFTWLMHCESPPDVLGKHISFQRDLLAAALSLLEIRKNNAGKKFNVDYNKKNFWLQTNNIVLLASAFPQSIRFSKMLWNAPLLKSTSYSNFASILLSFQFVLDSLASCRCLNTKHKVLLPFWKILASCRTLARFSAFLPHRTRILTSCRFHSFNFGVLWLHIHQPSSNSTRTNAILIALHCTISNCMEACQTMSNYIWSLGVPLLHYKFYTGFYESRRSFT